MLLLKYRNKVLAQPNWASRYLLTTKDFRNMDAVISFFYDYSDHEVDLTVDGYKFLDEYYGMNEIANHLVGIEYIAYDQTVDDIQEYIKYRVSHLYGVQL